ncbi:MAG: MmcQ/YjbR family DNA-binding protein [Melioribacteraceae bacterium]|nr:MAG: MmcQ/YjbR family DNA-binding protein [Melioribacteraceae bacterium]
MDIEKLREYCLKKKGVTEGFPFGDDTLVFKVMEKMFCLTNLTPPLNINLKCDPEKAIELREEYDFVRPGYHMNKQHWNTIDLERVAMPKLIYEWIDDSYNLVVNSLTKKIRVELNKK